MVEGQEFIGYVYLIETGKREACFRHLNVTESRKALYSGFQPSVDRGISDFNPQNSGLKNPFCYLYDLWNY